MSKEVLSVFEVNEIMGRSRPKTGWAYDLCREIEAAVVSRCRAQGGITSENITQAAANKAAEEGELPAGWKLVAVSPEFDDLMYYLDRQNSNGRLSSDLETTWEAFDYDSADRAARPVANKAEVEPVAWACPLTLAGTLMEKPDVEWGPVNNWADKFKPFPLYATPPATTGASTAPMMELRARIAEMREAGYTISQCPEMANAIFDSVTDALDEVVADAGERGDLAVLNDARQQTLEEAAQQIEKLYVGLGGQPDSPCPDSILYNEAINACASTVRGFKGSAPASTVLTDERIAELYEETRLPMPFARAIEREVAAQAGQVAVPEGWKLVPPHATAEMLKAFFAEDVTQNGYIEMLTAAPSPAKESK